MSLMLVNDDESNMRYDGEWDQEYVAGSYRADKHYTENDGDSLSYLFFGSGVELISDMDPGMGELEIIIFLSACLCIFSGAVVAIFLNDPDVVDYGSHFLRGLSIALPFLCFDFIGVAVFQACGMGRKSLIFAIMRKIVLEIPALVVLNMLSPLYGLAYAQFTAEVILAVAAGLVLMRMFKKDFV